MQNRIAPVLEARGLCKSYVEPNGAHLFGHRRNPAVQGVSFAIHSGETFGIVGESGCGKSTVAKLLMGLERPDAGEVYFRGARIDKLSPAKLRPLRPRFQMVFQDSSSSLNGRKRVQDILAEPMLYHRIVDRDRIRARVEELLTMVGLPVNAMQRYPHEFSGGQRQRICIAKALSLNPELVVLDEPVSALDVSVQAQILNLLRDLQEQLGLAYLFIGHGLGGGTLHQPPHRRDVPGPVRRAGRLRGAVPPPRSPLHPGAAGRCALGRLRAAQPQAHRASGRGAGCRLERRLCVSRALPLRRLRLRPCMRRNASRRAGK